LAGSKIHNKKTPMRHIKGYIEHLKESSRPKGLEFERPKHPLDSSIRELTAEERSYAEELIEKAGEQLVGVEVSGWKVDFDGFMNNYSATNMGGEEVEGSIDIRIAPFFQNDDCVYGQVSFWNDENCWGELMVNLPYNVYNLMDLYMTGKIEEDARFLSSLVVEIIRRSIGLISKAKSEEEIESHVDPVPYTPPGEEERIFRGAKKNRARGAFGRF